MRIEPPPSVPSATGTIPAATAAALPPDEPPVFRDMSNGFRLGPNSGLSQVPRNPNDRAVGLADDDRARALHSLRPGAVEVGHEVLESPHTAERRRPARLEVKEILHGGRN